jgi:hypothetical protein
MKTYFFGWTNIKWFISEIGKMYSSKDSYFSKKRIESGIAFAISQWGMIEFLVKKIDTMTSSDIAIWAGIEFAVAGYMVNQIQKEKKDGTQVHPTGEVTDEPINS